MKLWGGCRLLFNITKNVRVIRRKNGGRISIVGDMLIRENCFMENSIPGGKYLMCFKVKQFVSFLAKRISQKYTRNSSSLELVSAIFQCRSITKTTENFEMIIARLLAKQNGKRTHAFKNLRRKPVDKLSLIHI